MADATTRMTRAANQCSFKAITAEPAPEGTHQRRSPGRIARTLAICIGLLCRALGCSVEQRSPIVC